LQIVGQQSICNQSHARRVNYKGKITILEMTLGLLFFDPLIVQGESRLT